MSSPCDLFISYKSEDANRVRPVAELLISQGIRVWFAEYQVLLSNYANFQEAIDAGIDGATYGLVFSNDRWAGSPYCEKEIVRLQGRLPPECILQVCLPWQPMSISKYETLGRSPTLRATGSAREVLAFVAEHTELPIDLNRLPLTDPARNPTEWIDRELCCRIQMDLGPLHRSNLAPNPEQKLTGHFIGTIAGFSTRMAVFVSQSTTALGKMAIPADGASDDRKVYGDYRRYAEEEFFGPRGIQERGLHLFFYRGASQFALTYSYNDPRSNLVQWERRYTLLVEGRSSAPAATTDYARLVTQTEEATLGEVDIVFAVEMRPGEDQESLAQFCRLTTTLDAIVTSLVYEPTTLLGVPFEGDHPQGLFAHPSLPFTLNLPSRAEVEEIGDSLVRLKLRSWNDHLTILKTEHFDQNNAMVPSGWMEIEQLRLTDGSPLWVIQQIPVPLSVKLRRSVIPAVLSLLAVISLSVSLTSMPWMMGSLGSGCVISLWLLVLFTELPIQFVFVRDGIKYEIGGPSFRREQIKTILDPILHGVSGPLRPWLE